MSLSRFLGILTRQGHYLLHGLPCRVRELTQRAKGELLRGPCAAKKFEDVSRESEGTDWMVMLWP